MALFKFAELRIETAGGRVWRGTCRGDQDEPKSFGINVDRVWTPSKPTN